MLKKGLPAACVVALGLLCAGGCPSSDSTDSKTGQLVTIAPSDLDKAPYEAGEIIIVGTTIVSKLKHEAADKGFKLTSLMEDGQPYEVETYELDESSLKFRGTDIESFEPAIPLLTLPFYAPDKWTWAGKMTLAGKTFGASAEAASVSETLNVPGGPYKTVKVTLDLTIQGASGKRKLTFWLSKDSGIIKRDFAQSSTRQPASENKG